MAIEILQHEIKIKLCEKQTWSVKHHWWSHWVNSVVKMGTEVLAHRWTEVWAHRRGRTIWVPWHRFVMWGWALVVALVTIVENEGWWNWHVVLLL